jgi:hypothetical protein
MVAQQPQTLAAAVVVVAVYPTLELVATAALV